ncbi:hypothetical protein ANCCEY_01991 [Ancylostoma ceylanicum]|uniref:Uncharacterized protein n=1 Tax=Ancylostoma ceylanicum TaxID=53326 RepID=A0A0D6M620_9BILA|nr:hypothetical protein ANCCEY_01991 [Ancylostoma ceylanicum]
MLTSPAGQAQLPAYLKDPHPIFPFPQKSADLSQPSFLYGMVKKQQNDDYVKLIREQDLSDERISAIPIPVPQALSLDPNVCRKVLGDRFSSDDDFWESLRDSMRKLAARCRRVRHAKKTKSSREEGVLLAGEKSAGWPEGSVAQTLQSLNLPTEKPTHSVRTIPIVAERKKTAEISDMKLAETLQSGLHALASATLANQSISRL